ncbi:MAG: DUF2382 domain-containing protein [Acidimicrobiia bacterium]
MATMNASELRSWVGHTAIDNQGSKVGKITDIYMDQSTHQPEWLTVKTGMFGGNVSFVPLAGATPAGDDVKVAYDKDTITSAPNIPAEGEISEDEEDELYRYYGPGQGVAQSGTGTAETGAPRGSTDDAMTRSEEELEVGTRRRERGRARLHKWVETEDVQVTVPVEREKARMVTEPITDENRDAAMSGPEISEADREVTLREEEIDVSKRAVPKERVRLEKETEVEEVPVSEQVRKEHIEREDDAGRG